MKGIKGGLAIKGTGTFKFCIKNNEGAVHLIKITNKKHIPELKIFLLLPHQWVQEAQDKYPLPRGMRMEEDDEALILLIWKQGKHRRTTPYHPQPTVHPLEPHQHCAPTAPSEPFVKLLKHSATIRSMSFECPANSNLMKSLQQRKTCMPTS